VARWILHVDLDQFLAAVEVRRRPELRGRPVIVGTSGNPTQPRTVVTCASYESRAFGVRAGMALPVAARKCPDAVFIKSDNAAYEVASAEVMDLLRAFPVRVEVWGWDEAFLAADTDDPEALAQQIRQPLDPGWLGEPGGQLGAYFGVADPHRTRKLEFVTDALANLLGQRLRFVGVGCEKRFVPTPHFDPNGKRPQQIHHFG